MLEKNVSQVIERPPLDTQVHLLSWQGDVPATVQQVKDKLKEDPENVELIILLGRELSRAGLFREAVEVYSRGIALDHTNHFLFRHRGHRYISTRRYPEAVADLRQAAALEPAFWDTLYHLGLAYYLEGDFERAERAYGRCLAETSTEDHLCAIVDWYYLTLMRLGQHEAAQAVASRVSPETEAGENEPYKQRILVYRRLVSPEEAMTELQTADDHGYSNGAYGIAMEYYFRGQKENAREILASICDKSSAWYGFAALAAEADKARLVF